MGRLTQTLIWALGGLFDLGFGSLSIWVFLFFLVCIYLFVCYLLIYFVLREIAKKKICELF